VTASAGCLSLLWLHSQVLLPATGVLLTSQLHTTTINPWHLTCRPGSAVERLAADEWPLSNASSSAHSSRSSEDKATPTHFLYMVRGLWDFHHKLCRYASWMASDHRLRVCGTASGSKDHNNYGEQTFTMACFTSTCRSSLTRSATCPAALSSTCHAGSRSAAAESRGSPTVTLQPLLGHAQLYASLQPLTGMGAAVMMTAGSGGRRNHHSSPCCLGLPSG
jgi:hypothetical protein